MKAISAALATALAAASAQAGKIYSASDISRYITLAKKRGWRATGSIAMFNRHTGTPHEHKREIARRARQAAK